MPTIRKGETCKTGESKKPNESIKMPAINCPNIMVVKANAAPRTGKAAIVAQTFIRPYRPPISCQDLRLLYLEKSPSPKKIRIIKEIMLPPKKEIKEA